MTESRFPLDLAPLIMQASQLQIDMILTRLHARGFGDFTCAFSGVMPFIDVHGIRATELVQRIGVSKQAISQLITLLEKRGYIEKADDDQDTRAKLIRLTQRGAAVKTACREVQEELLAVALDALGEQDAAILKSCLVRLIESMGEQPRTTLCCNAPQPTGTPDS